MNTLKYILLLILVIPFIPYMIYQGMAIRKKIPKLPPPEDLKGSVGKNKNQLNLLCIGESTVAGIGVKSHRVGIAGKLAEYFSLHLNKKINYEVFAKSGFTAEELFDKLQNEQFEIKPDIIVIGTGANDGFHLRSPNTFIKYTKHIIHFLKNKAPHVPIVFATLPPISLFPAFPKVVRYFVSSLVNLYRDELIKLTPSMGNVYFDERLIENMDWGLKERPITDFFSDGVHPSELTYGLWAENTGEFILEKNILKS